MIREPYFIQSKELIANEFVVFRTDESRLKKIKLVVNVDKNINHDFEVSDEVRSLDFPYLYFLYGTKVNIFSLLTSKLLIYDIIFL